MSRFLSRVAKSLSRESSCICMACLKSTWQVNVTVNSPAKESSLELSARTCFGTGASSVVMQHAGKSIMRRPLSAVV